MSPAKYEGGKMPANPSHQMKALDDDGLSYWLEDVSMIDGFAIERADVMSHNPDWLTVRTPEAGFSEARTWTLRTAHVVRFRIVEG